MLDRTFSEPRHHRVDLRSDAARVLIRIEPKNGGQAVEIKIADALNSWAHFDAEDTELKEGGPDDPFSRPVAVYKIKRTLVLTVNGEAAFRFAKD